MQEEAYYDEGLHQRRLCLHQMCIRDSKYTVVAGDTLSRIAAKYGTTVAKLAADNGIDVYKRQA